MANHQPSGQRRELKYIVTEDVARQIRCFAANHLEIDEYGACCEDLSYPVHSLYLDSDDLCLYWEKVNGSKNRYKLRLRYYSTHADAPVYFEIKRRVNDAVLKQRGAVRRECVSEILTGQAPAPDMLVSPCSARHMVAIQRFGELRVAIQAKPKAHVAYSREAWTDWDNAARITIDRHVRCAPELSARLASEMADPVFPFGHHAIVEIKFTARFPNWFKDLAQAFGLVSCSSGKYVDGVAMGGEDRFHSPGWVERTLPSKVLARREFLQRLALVPGE
jgi:SPX domain protein involved in polyphosphate accumulation